MPRPRLAALALLASLTLVSAPPTRGAESEEPISRPSAILKTEAVPSRGDAADDPAIWIHPNDPAQSLLLGTDKKGGLHVYDLDAHHRQVISDGSRPNNVDILYGIPLVGKPVDLAIAGCRDKKSPGLKVWTIDPDTRRLAELEPGATFPTFGGGEPYGSCAYRSPRDGRSYVFVNDHDGAFEQYRLDPATDGTLNAVKVRQFRVGSQSEGCVADRETGRLYIAEEDVGIWSYDAEPDGGDHREPVARVGEYGLTADVEGLTLYYGPNGRGYLIASSQGNHTLHVYDRQGDHRHLLTIDPAAGPLGDIHDTDGLDVTSLPTTSAFPHGLLVVQDGGEQAFKLFSWDDVAAGRLSTEPGPSPRSR